MGLEKKFPDRILDTPIAELGFFGAAAGAATMGMRPIVDVQSGFNTVMLDSCHLPYKENVDITRKVVNLARPHGVEVQGELGCLPNFGEEAAGTLTDPEIAVQFVSETGIDFLAVSIGNVHLQTEGTCCIDRERLRRIHEMVGVPLVIHGGSGFPQETVSEVIKTGVSLFHFGTLMKKVFLEETIKTSQRLKGVAKLDYQALTGSRKETDVLMHAKLAVKNIVKEYIRLYGSTGKAF